MPESYIEREDKFDIEAGFILPDLTQADSAIAEARTSDHQLRSEYFDTADRALRVAAMTFRHRSGSSDTGWQLKVPHEAAREEIRVEAESAEVPDELSQLLRGVRRDQELAPVAVLQLARTVTELLDADGQKLAEVAFDTVRAEVPSQAEQHWQEVEVELGPAGDELTLARLGKALRRAGARRSEHRSKLARALGPEASVEPAADDLLQRYLLDQQRALLAGDLALRRGDDSVIHKTRVGIRRWRSTLRTFLDRESARTLDDELRWYAGVLGEVRDRQVMRKRLLGLVDQLADVEILGPVRTRIEVQLQLEQQEAWTRVGEVLDSDRYLALLTAVNDFRLSLHKIPGKRLTKLMVRADRKAANRLARAGSDPVQLHRARKAAKRARYAGELVEPFAGTKASKQVARNEALQDMLGENQDILVTGELLKRLGEIAGTTQGENGFTFGLLYERERQRGEQILGQL